MHFIDRQAFKRIRFGFFFKNRFYGDYIFCIFKLMKFLKNALYEYLRYDDFMKIDIP